MMRPSNLFLFVRSLFWTLVGPGLVTVVLPYFIVTRWYPTHFPGWGVLQIITLFPILVGGVIVGHCVWNFAVQGQGTLSPLDAPRHLVVQGLYRYVRNPMYVGVLLILFGESLLFQSTALLAYCAAWFVMVNFAIVFYEEPRLRRQFGESYERYRRSVRRWLPGRPPGQTSQSK